jgi:hypothetical protein
MQHDALRLGPKDFWAGEGMMNRFFPRSRASLKETLRRIDRVAGDLNVLLVVIAIGLAALDATFLLTQKVIDHLPPVTRISYDSPPPPAN